jgi:hypothetical protein
MARNYLKEVPRFQIGKIDFTLSNLVDLSVLVKGDEWQNPWLRWGVSDVGGLLVIIFGSDKKAEVTIMGVPKQNISQDEVLDIFLFGKVKPYCVIIIDNLTSPLRILNKIELEFTEAINKIIDDLLKELLNLQEDISYMRKLKSKLEVPKLYGDGVTGDTLVLQYLIDRNKF